jgi:hypothetical protein
MTEIEHRRLDELAGEIATEVRLAEEAWRGAVGHAIAAGEKLIEAKRLVPHGGWLSWLEANCPLGEREAQNYMRLARNPQRVADLSSVRQAVALLAGWKTKPELDADEPTAESVEAIVERELGPPPKREDFNGVTPGPRLDEVTFLFAQLDYGRDRRIALWGKALAEARAVLAGGDTESDPDLVATASAIMAVASTGIRAEEAERAVERRDDNGYEERDEAARRAWVAHEAARDAFYVLAGQEDER